MTRVVSEGRSLFRPVKPRDNLYRVLLLVVLILGGVWLLHLVGGGVVKPVLLPTPTPTRTVNSYIQQAQAYFDAGKLDDPASQNDAIDTYLAALAVDPNDADALAELARIETYSSSALSSDSARLARLQEAKTHIDQAVALAPDDSTVHAVRAFVLDWYASSNLLTADERQDALNEAEGSAVRSLQLDPNNILALAFYAEVLVDQQNWDQALQYAEQAVARAPNSFDAHRVYATVLETLGRYRDSISEFNRAAELAPNLTYLYLRIGYGYRNLGSRAATEDAAKALYDTALIYFDRAATINAQLGLKDPQPFIAIAKTYAQEGEFLIASLNAEKALSFNPSDADTYGQLGMIYVQARNYESALPALQCAVEGCDTWWRLPPDDISAQAGLPCHKDDCTPLMCEKAGCSDKEKSVALSWYGADYQIKQITVAPLELTNLTVAYYYVRYGSVLAYLSEKGDGKCDKVYTLMELLRQTFPDDPLLLGNIEDNEATCQMLSGTPNPSP